MNKLPKSSGIYRFLNWVNGKMYVGSAVNIFNRNKNHLIELKLNRHFNRYLQSAWNKYGANNFTFEILELVENKENLKIREQHWIDFYNSADRNYGYNLSPTAGSPLGVKHREEVKKAASERRKGQILNKEWRDNISKALTGTKATSTAKANISLSLTGRTLTEEHAEKIGNYGRKLDKWPCFNGYYCKCDKCREVKAAKMREYRKSKMENIRWLI